MNKGLNRYRSVMPREYKGGWTLLKKCPDGTVFIGTDVGVVMTATILPGGDSPDDTFKQPLTMREAATAIRSAKQRWQKTAERPMFRDGAMIQTALGGDELVLKAYHLPNGAFCVAGWDRRLKVWVVE